MSKKKFYVVMAGEITYYSTDVVCQGGFIYIHNGLSTRFTYKELRHSVTVDFNDVTNIYTHNRCGFILALSTFGYKLDDNDNIVPELKIETFVSFKPLDTIVAEITKAEDRQADITELYDRLNGVNLSQYEKLRQMFGERKKADCEFNESETYLIFERCWININNLIFEGREV